MDEYRDLLLSSGLALRRPVDDQPRLQAMLRNANLVFTARVGGVLVGIARSVTDHAFCCYLSDLAVHNDFKGQGIGAELVRLTKQHSGPQVNLILSSVPESVGFYAAIGMQRLTDCFWIRREY